MDEYLGANFVWFFGVVEDRNDPLKMGRVRVRCYYWHTEDKGKLPTEELPWAQVTTPITNAAMGDVGQTPLGLVEGTWVMGFFMDGEVAQKPMILSSIPGIPFEQPPTQQGFSDPNGVYPKRVGEPDVNRLARNQEDYLPTNLAIKDQGRTTNVADASGGLWSEPASAYNATYPKNHVYESERGHIFEVDDTEGSERIHQYHRSGTFFEIDKDGNKVTRVVGDNYEIIAGSNYVNVKGSANLTVDETLNIKAKTINIEAETINETATTGNVTYNNGEITVGGITQTQHTHTDTAGLAAGTTSTPNSGT